MTGDATSHRIALDCRYLGPLKFVIHRTNLKKVAGCHVVFINEFTDESQLRKNMLVKDIRKNMMII